MLVASVAIVVCALMIKRVEREAAEMAAFSPTPASAPELEGEAASAGEEDAPPAQADWRVWQNAKYGFQITLSEVWRGYKIKEYQGVEVGEVARFSVLLETNDANYRDLIDEKAAAFTIAVYEKEAWGQKDKDTLRQSELAKSERWVFAYSTWETPPTDWQVLAEKEIADTLETFSLTESRL